MINNLRELEKLMRQVPVFDRTTPGIENVPYLNVDPENRILDFHVCVLRQERPKGHRTTGIKVYWKVEGLSSTFCLYGRATLPRPNRPGQIVELYQIHTKKPDGRTLSIVTKDAYIENISMSVQSILIWPTVRGKKAPSFIFRRPNDDGQSGNDLVLYVSLEDATNIVKGIDPIMQHEYHMYFGKPLTLVIDPREAARKLIADSQIEGFVSQAIAGLVPKEKET